jgi:imidazolonepropionase-like amidohydrolase
VTAWAIHGVELPFGDRRQDWWVDASGTMSDQPVEGAEPLPGHFVLAGLVDAHSHPAVGAGPSGPRALSAEDTRANLLAWAESGITLVRDVGSPGGLTLNLAPGPRWPAVHAAGRFLAPEHRYFEELLVEPVAEEDLIDVGLAQIRAGATWVKVIGDFPRVPEMTDKAPTYPAELIARLCTAVHGAGARVAVHATLPEVGPLVSAGVDSIEHGTALSSSEIADMGRRQVAWTPTLCAALSALHNEDAPPARRQEASETRARMKELLPQAVRLGVPVLAGTDVVGSLPREVALLAELGLSPSEALAAGSVWGRQFIGAHPDRVDIVTYDHDPRQDITQLQQPRAVVVGGIRLL